jgi:hypothetical protein
MVNLAKIFVGAPCERCGCQEKWLTSHSCVECSRARLRSPAHRARTRAWYAANKDAHKELRDSWRSARRPQVRAQNTAWRKNNLGRMCALVRAYQLRKQKQMPAWANQEAIAKFYEARPEGMHVDHVIPLKGKLVSGLHVETNLQYLPGVENNRKGNRYAC